jgi:hypothetical protein
MNCIDPTPEQVLELIGEISTELLNAKYDNTVEREHEKVYDKISIGDIRRSFAVEMNKRDWRFSSAYRHEVTPLHSACYSILGSTVGMNWMADDLLKASRAVTA